MTGDLIINSRDALTEWGVSMGKGFIEALMAPAPMKDLVENESRLEHGKRVIVDHLRLASREVSLSFHILGSTPSDYLAKYSAFMSELQKVAISIRLPKVDGQAYKLLYKKHVSFAQNYRQTSSTLAVRFEEPNPADRA